MNKINFIRLFPVFLSLCFGGYEWNACKTKINVDLGSQAISQLSKEEIRELRSETENTCLEALNLEPENAYIAFFIAKELYENQLKEYNKAAEMYLQAINRPDGELGSQHALKMGRGKYLTSVHELIKTYAPKWFNYGVDANNKSQFDNAIKNFIYASKFDSDFILRSYGAIAEIYYENKADLNLAIESLDTALNSTNDSKVITDLKLRKITYLRKSGEKEKAKKIVMELLNDDGDSIPVQLQLFHLYMDNSDCLNALKIGPELFIKMEENPRIPMENLSELAFNIGACYNQEGDVKYNLIIDYYGNKENHTNDLTNKNLDFCQDTINYYNLAKEYFRNSQAYEEETSETTKQFKKDMRSKVKGIEQELIPSLEALLE
tara:strand:+ start:1117 stop:2250 length:1134 start_codon:yes stop_codon:yes gene_type:complete